jgi:SNF family Na+-dependent transporter
MNSMMKLCRIYKPGWDNTERGGWKSGWQSVTSMIAVTIGLDNIWNFTYLVGKDKSGAFLLAYVLLTALVGIPILTLEMAIGQFTSCSAMNCWQFCRLFRGVGLTQILLMLSFTQTQTVIMSKTVLYFLLAFLEEHPWAKCDSSFASKMCIDRPMVRTAAECQKRGLVMDVNGTCYSNDSRLAGFWNDSLARSKGIQWQLPSHQYMVNVIFQYNADGVQDLDLNWQLAGSLFVCWLVILFCVTWGLQFLHNSTTALIILGMGLLLLLMCVALSLKGAGAGIMQALSVNSSQLLSPDLWETALAVVVLDVGLARGVAMTLSSYSPYKGDVCLYAAFVSLANVMATCMSILMTFGFVGFLANKLNVDMYDLISGFKYGPLAFLPYAMHHVGLGRTPHVLLVLYCVMSFNIGITSQASFHPAMLAQNLNCKLKFSAMYCKVEWASSLC